jgi:lysophospholipase L1-like esterase
VTGKWVVRASLCLALIASACSSSSGDAERAAPQEQTERPTEERDELVYAAVGASETLGWGARNFTTQSWPRVLLEEALPGFELVNLGLPGATVEDALARELPRLREVRPDIVTVWLNANDIFQGVHPRDFAADLDRLLGAIESAGPAQVLVANTPPLDALPAYRACLPDPPADGPFCFLGGSLPAPNQMRSVVHRYNRIIERVAKRRGATLVDLYSGALEAHRNGRDARLVSNDGLHPSTEGHRAIAESFGAQVEWP